MKSIRLICITLALLTPTQGVLANEQPLDKERIKSIERNAIMLGLCTIVEALCLYQFRSYYKTMYINNTTQQYDVVKEIDPVKLRYTYAYSAAGVLAFIGMAWFSYKISTKLTQEDIKQWLMKRKNSIKTLLPKCFSSTNKE